MIESSFNHLYFCLNMWLPLNDGERSGSDFPVTDICDFNLAAFRAACRGSVFGNRATNEAKPNRITPSNPQPNHQAPSHRGSDVLMVGVNVGEM